LVWTVTVAALISLSSSADKQRKARVLHDGRFEFTPNKRAFWTWPLLVVYLVYATVSHLKDSQVKPLNLIIAACLRILRGHVHVVVPGNDSRDSPCGLNRSLGFGRISRFAGQTS
jgi:hypothetical protein